MKKRLSATRFILASALSALLALTACTGCRRDKPVDTDPAEDTARQSASPVPFEPIEKVTPEPAEKATPVPGTVTASEIPDGGIYLPPIPVDDTDDEFKPTPQPTGEPEPTEPEPTGEPEPTQEPEPTEPEPTGETVPEPGQTEEPTPTPKPGENETPILP